MKERNQKSIYETKIEVEKDESNLEFNTEINIISS